MRIPQYMKFLVGLSAVLYTPHAFGDSESDFIAAYKWIMDVAYYDTTAARNVGETYLECIRTRPELVQQRIVATAYGAVEGETPSCSTAKDAIRSVLSALEEPFARVLKYGPRSNCTADISTRMFGMQRVLYVRLRKFCVGGAKVLAGRVKRMMRPSMRYNGIILDLRDNPGGDVGASYRIGSLFVSDALLGAYRNAKGQGKMMFSPSQNTLLHSVPIAVIVNGTTASAAELLLYTLLDNDRVVSVLGTSTFGKGVYQHERVFQSFGKLQVTAGVLLRPNMEQWHNVPYEPSHRLDFDSIDEDDVLLEAWRLLAPHAQKGDHLGTYRLTDIAFQ